MPKGVLVDVSRCIGCRSCQTACKNYYDLPATLPATKESWNNPPELSATDWTRVSYHMIKKDGRVQWRFVKNQCMHCNEPACESACFTHAFLKTENGPVVYKPTDLNKDYCVGCRYCMIACPFNVPKFEWDKTFPYVRKCKFCFERLNQGLKPACVSACPTEAIKFGDRDNLLAEAWQRINRESRYVKHVYGEKEYGGTAWMYISDVPFEQLGFKTNVSERSIPSYSWNVLRWTPYIFVGWGAILTAMRYYTKKRSQTHDESEMYAPVDKG
ncbi:MAG TPA: 4Fe-4S dicluster domain-containing protein [Bacillota bacterium]|nr:4Fe-4S dicluster domain-containing protein [Bacillota bacterium]